MQYNVKLKHNLLREKLLISNKADINKTKKEKHTLNVYKVFNRSRLMLIKPLIGTEYDSHIVLINRLVNLKYVRLLLF